jgi:hypothetical protein
MNPFGEGTPNTLGADRRQKAAQLPLTVGEVVAELLKMPQEAFLLKSTWDGYDPLREGPKVCVCRPSGKDLSAHLGWSEVFDPEYTTDEDYEEPRHTVVII